ncbi:hypothetical protein C7212DRAFT_322691, partial [Tuber magnatum]
MYLEELARVLHDEFDEWVSVATLSRYLKKEGWVKEKVSDPKQREPKLSQPELMGGKPRTARM